MKTQTFGTNACLEGLIQKWRECARVQRANQQAAAVSDADWHGGYATCAETFIADLEALAALPGEAPAERCYLVEREHAQDETKPLIELERGPTIGGKTLFTRKSIPAAAAPAVDSGHWSADDMLEATRALRGETTAPRMTGGREALEYDWDAAHEALESMDDYARMDVGVAPHGPYTVLRDLLTKAKGWKEQADRLAALAGAAPVAWNITVDGRHIMHTDGSMTPPEKLAQQLRDYHPRKRVEVIPLYTHPHAPAKAREVNVDMVAAACAALIDHELGPRSVAHAAMQAALTAALATFAEGEE